jgi:hypothetical protein
MQLRVSESAQICLKHFAKILKIIVKEFFFSSEAFTCKPLIQVFKVIIHPLNIGGYDGLDVVGRRLCLLEQHGIGLHQILYLIAKKRDSSVTCHEEREETDKYRSQN